MFDKLVESTKQKQKGRNKFYLVTSLIYGTSLFTLAVSTILWFSPALAETARLVTMIEPPPVPAPAPPPELSPVAPAPETIFAAPVKPPDRIPIATTVPPKPRTDRPTDYVIGAINTGADRDYSSTIGSRIGDDGEPPPPPPRPTPKADPTPTPAPKQQEILKMTSVLLQGKSINKVQPPYPKIARDTRTQGTVQVAVIISEQGRVLSAEAVSGHPLLREAALNAARQWTFSPTNLNGTPVKVSGIIAFNFVLN